MAKLILVRHGVSEWNKLGLWTGWTDINLAPEGYDEAKRTAEAIKDIHIDFAFVSDLKRAQQTLDTIKSVIGYDMPTTVAWELKERNYGDLTGKNKWEIKEKYGEDQFNKWRRGWDDICPNGENLKQVSERTIPYFYSNILPLVKEGKNVIVSAHSNSLRALIKYLDKVPDSESAKVEIQTAEAYVYEITEDGIIISKEVRATNSNKV